MKTRTQLEKQAEKRGVAIYFAPANETYLLVDIRTNAPVTPKPLTLEQLETWLDDLDRDDAE